MGVVRCNAVHMHMRFVITRGWYVLLKMLFLCTRMVVIFMAGVLLSLAHGVGLTDSCTAAIV